ncbi:hypothetical protein DPSP01_005426 [Paraphaeosphaeria sporulosa]|uniref:Rhodopsin domain-containing protein n=1 Tax=Paraphaeosphaeria sporulosa TaxID=1460663 RepID=A0A177CEM1_9PLEO|nr:uncharacterized protein CC84DRAFT_1218584 [Paraphaeosphaeria sporulosa]OAG05217.1 hypothetical protein CC84DRAFT_1218584 [Paraphaeosphaeria sporulosa]
MASSPAGMAQTMLNTVVLVFTLMAGLIMFLRLFTRGLLLHKAGAEDAWISLAMILSIGLTVTIALQVQNGLGKHMQELTPAMMTDSLKAFWASVWIYNLSLTATKMSILTQYLRVFPIPRYRVACYVVMAFVALYGLWTLLGSIFLCFPVAFFWDKTIADGRCLNQEAIWFSNATINIVQDVVILILPIAVLKSLPIPSRQKKALIAVFGLGGVVCLVSIIRLQTLVSISNSTDPTFDNPPAAMLSAIETNVGIICACLPSMRPLLTSMMPVYFPEGSQLRGSQYHNTSRFDVEQPKHMRCHSGSSRPHTADSFGKPDHPRSGSAASHGYKPSSQTSRSHSRSGSTGPIYTPTAHGRSQSTSANQSRTGSRNGHSRTPSNSMNVPTSTELQPLSNSYVVPQTTHNNPRQLNLSNGHQHPMNPLRMSPFSPDIPRLPRLPENMAVLGPLDSQERPIRMPLFHKPLPITPLPGHQNAQYLTKAQDQAMLPMMLSPTLSQSPGLMPEPLNLGVKSPAPSHLDRRSAYRT